MITIILFLFVCMVLRSFAVYLAYKQILLKLLGIVYILSGLGIFLINVFKLRKTGIVGQKAWWDSFRPIFAIIYLLFGIFAFQEKPYAWKILLMDIIFGLALFINNHYFQ